MKEFHYITLREKPELMNMAAEWFHSKWGVPAEAYLECMEAYLKQETELGWYLCMEANQIVGGLGVIENDFHDRKDLTPNVMQEDFLKNLRDLIKRGESRAILVSATGTGKTYASAFAVKDFRPKRFLFLVHREQIAKQSINATRYGITAGCP